MYPVYMMEGLALHKHVVIAWRRKVVWVRSEMIKIIKTSFFSILF
jgi:hypothetical protein